MSYDFELICICELYICVLCGLAAVDLGAALLSKPFRDFHELFLCEGISICQQVNLFPLIPFETTHVHSSVSGRVFVLLSNAINFYNTGLHDDILAIIPSVCHVQPPLNPSCHV